MSDTVRWEPVPDGWDDEGDGSESSIGWDGKVISIVQDGEMMWHAPAPDIRLCRAVPAATWSQEPPDAPGQTLELWVWHAGEEERMVYPYAVRWEVRKGRYVFVLPDGSTAELSDMPPDTWYMPATVPQPPGEVGP